MISLSASTSVDPFPRAGIAPGEPGEMDMYTDLFAALFTFPVTPPQFQPEPKPQGESIGDHDLILSALPTEVTEAEALDAFFADAAAKDQKVQIAPVLPELPKRSNAETNAAFLLKPLKGDMPHIGPQSEYRKLIELFGQPVKPEPNDKSWQKKTDEKVHLDHGAIKPPIDCYLPPRGDPKGENIRFDLVSIDEFEYRADIEVLEIPSSLTRGPFAESEQVLEIAPDISETKTAPAAEVPVEAAVLDAGTQTKHDPIPLESALTLDMQSAEKRLEGAYIPLPALPPTAVKTGDIQSPDEPVKPMVSLLETFTNNVFGENKPINRALRTEFTEFGDLDEVSGEIQKSAEETNNTHQATEFSFGSSLGGEAINERVEDLVLQDAKAKRLILDQVGSKLSEIAALQKDGDRNVLKIRLKPAELGTVEITLAKNSDGVLTAHFQTESPHTQNILNESLAALRESLENSGIKVGSLDTSCTTFSSAGDERKGEAAREFPLDDERSAAVLDSDQRPVDEKSNRLVNLRA